MAKFKVKDVFTLEDRMPVFIRGEIVDGEISKGDLVKLTWNPEMEIEGNICAVEYDDSKDGSFVCLGIDCSSHDEQNIWLEMNVQEGEILDVGANT